jgi:hypothetical protein
MIGIKKNHKGAYMFNRVKIKRFIINKNDTASIMLERYFASEKWDTKQNGIYCYHRTSIFMKIFENPDCLYIDFWGEGPFGVIYAYHSRSVSLFAKKLFRSIENDFRTNLITYKSIFSETLIETKGVNASLYYPVTITLSICIAIVILYIIRSC